MACKTTHHLACDCREEYFKELKSLADELADDLQFALTQYNGNESELNEDEQYLRDRFAKSLTRYREAVGE